MNPLRQTRRARMRPALTTAALVALAGASAGALNARTAHAGDPGVERKAVCAETACLVMLWDVDSDGDGVSDVDETALRSNPRDVASSPPAEVVISRALERALPSFENATSIVVALPTVEDGLATDVFGHQVRSTATERSLAALRQGLQL